MNPTRIVYNHLNSYRLSILKRSFVMIHRIPFALVVFVFSAGAIGLFGCKDPNTGGKKSDDKTQSKEKSGEKKTDATPHDHPTEGPHGGVLVEWGDDIFHVEFTVDAATKTATLYILDDKAKPSSKIDAGKISKVKVHIINTKPPVAVEMKHDAKKSSDKDGVAFVGTHERYGQPGEIHGSVDGVVEGHPPFSGDFKTKSGEKKK